MLTTVSEAVVRLMQSQNPVALNVSEGGTSGYVVTWDEPLHDPGNGQPLESRMGRTLEISKAEAKLLLSKGATWSGDDLKQPR